MAFKKSRVWRFLSSLQLALVLILALVAMGVIGTFLVQAPAGVSSDPVEYDWWLQNVAQPQTGFWFPVLRSLGFFDIFHSPWFLGAGALLIVSIVVCSINRWNQVRASLSRRSVPTEADFQQGQGSPVEILQINVAGSSAADAPPILDQALRRHRYQTRTVTSGDRTYVVGDRNRFSALGTYFTHLSLILFVLGFMLGSYFGFRNVSLVVSENSTEQVGNGTGLAVRLADFTQELWPDGTPRSYRSEVVIYEDGEEAGLRVIEVNHPLIWHGVRFHQSFFGDAAGIQVLDTAGTLYEGNVALSGTFNDGTYSRPVGMLRLDGDGLLVYVVGRAAPAGDAFLSESQVGIQVYSLGTGKLVSASALDRGETLDLGDIALTFSGYADFSGLEVSKDPGNALIWIASGIFLAGLGMVFYFPRRQVWAMMVREADGRTAVFVRGGAGARSRSVSDLHGLAGDLERQLARHESSTKGDGGHG